jgi:hypothetical protein
MYTNTTKSNLKKKKLMEKSIRRKWKKCGSEKSNSNTYRPVHSEETASLII